MQIRCPVCDYIREVNLAKVPPTAEFATCPKCRHRFRFRAVDLDAVEHGAPQPEPKPEHADVWDAMDSLRNRWAEKDHDSGYQGEDTGGDDGNETEDAPRNRQPSPENTAIPWENPRHLGYPQSFLRTFLWAFLQPGNFFATLSRRPALLPALGFFLVFGLIRYLFSMLWLPFVLDVFRDRIIANGGEELFLAFSKAVESSPILPALLSAPFSLAIQLFVTALLLHLFIRIINPRESDFSLSFKIVAYSSVAFVLEIVPIAGSIAAQVWYLALLLIGCRHAFSMPWSRALITMAPLYLLLILGAAAQYIPYTSS